ncbi:MAG: hypothetical protein F8N15_09595 [Methanobacterium sp.]|nr:hypothetical protein [Methanobacterium sp.]
MKAVICTKYGPPEVLKLVDLKKPAPMNDEILIKVHATTVTSADIRIRGFIVPASYWIRRGYLNIKKLKQTNAIMQHMCNPIHIIFLKIFQFHVWKTII